MQETPLTNNEVNESETPDTQLFNNITYFPEGSHIWRQQGFYIVCQNCELHHAVYVGENKIMIGEIDGKPNLIDRKEYENYFKKK